MNNCNTTLGLVPNRAALPVFEWKQLPARLSKRLWVSPSEFLSLTHTLPVAGWALEMAGRWRPCLPVVTRRGPKPVYQDASILVMALLQVAWQLSYDEIVDYLRAHADAARAAGFAPERVISVGQYWTRRRQLGTLPFWFFFIGMVGQLVGMGVIVGKGSTWGYKVHTLMCRWSDLPIMFLITPAHRQESLLAIPLLILAVVCFGFTFTIVRADAGYFTYPILAFIHTGLRASTMIDYNLRRQGKRFLATRFFCWQWRFHLRPRSAIERLFARAKRYFGLESARWSGLVAAYQPTALLYATMLAVALIAHRLQRPELALSRSHVLALKTLT